MLGGTYCGHDVWKAVYPTADISHTRDLLLEVRLSNRVQGHSRLITIVCNLIDSAVHLCKTDRFKDVKFAGCNSNYPSKLKVKMLLDHNLATR